MKSILTALLVVAASTLAYAGAPASKNPKAPVAPAPAPGCDPMSYNYVELGWLHAEQDILGTLDGGYIDFSHQIVGNLFGEATVSLLGGDGDYTEYGAGLGYFVPVTEKFHLVARTGWANVDSDPGEQENEWYVSPGFRYQFCCRAELYGKAYLHMPEEGDSNWSAGGGVLVHLCPLTALDVGAAWGENSDEWSLQVGLRIKL
jgi:hypothetical protein